LVDGSDVEVELTNLRTNSLQMGGDDRRALNKGSTTRQWPKESRKSGT